MKYNYYEEFESVSLFSFNMEARVKWNKILLAAEIIVFHVRRSVQNAL